MTDALPPDFWGGRLEGGDHVWLHRANNHRIYQERFSIATYCRLGLDDKGLKPYKGSRPKRFWLIQQQWVKWMLEKERQGEKLCELKCMSTLQGWVTGMQPPKVISGTDWRRISLAELQFELPEQYGGSDAVFHSAAASFIDTAP